MEWHAVKSSATVPVVSNVCPTTSERSMCKKQDADQSNQSISRRNTLRRRRLTMLNPWPGVRSPAQSQCLVFNDGDMFMVTVPLVAAEHADPEITAPVTAPVSKYVRRLLDLLESDKAFGSADILQSFQLKSRRRLRETYIHPALKDDLIEMTVPDKPTSRLQKYRLTDKRRATLRHKKMETKK